MLMVCQSHDTVYGIRCAGLNAVGFGSSKTCAAEVGLRLFTWKLHFPLPPACALDGGLEPHPVLTRIACVGKIDKLASDDACHSGCTKGVLAISDTAYRQKKLSGVSASQKC